MRRLVSLAIMGAALVAATPAHALFHLAEISEVMGGTSGDPDVMFVEIRMQAVFQNQVAHSRLTYFDCFGSPPNVLLEVPANVVNQGADVRWIMGSQSVGGAFVSELGIAPDFFFNEAQINPSCGNICWGAPGLLPPNPPTWDPALPSNYVDCIAYGGYPGPLKAGQPVVAGPLGDGTHSLTRTGLTAFTLECPTPENNAGAVGGLASCTTTTTSSTTTTTLAPAIVDIDLSGAKLVLKDDPTNAAKRKATAVSKDPTVSVGLGNGSIDDPTVTGATVRIVSTTGDAFDDTYPLPAGQWLLIGKPGENKGYKYKDAPLLNGPVKTAVLKPTKLLKLSAKGSALGHTLAANPDPVDVVVTIGSQRFCQHYGGTVKHTPPKSFSAKLAPTSPGCPAP